MVLDFEGPGLPAIYGIRVGLTVHAPDGTTRQSIGTLPTANGTVTTGQLEAAMTPIALPTSAAFKLNGETGTLDIVAEALDLQKSTLATQTVVDTPIRSGETWTITLDFTAKASSALEGAGRASAAVAPANPDPTPRGDTDLERTGIEPTWSLAPVAPAR
jgi:hypothetical protein